MVPSNLGLLGLAPLKSWMVLSHLFQAPWPHTILTSSAEQTLVFLPWCLDAVTPCLPCVLELHTQPLWACLYASPAACLMLQKEIPFRASGDSYQAHHGTECICPALCLPFSLQNKNLGSSSSKQPRSQDQLTPATSTCPLPVFHASKRKPCSRYFRLSEWFQE